MEVVGWITIILLCALALAFVVIELGPVIHAEVSFWKFRKQKATEAKEDKARFNKEMRDLKYKAKKLDYMKKKGLITDEEVALCDAPAEEAIEENLEEEVEEIAQLEKETLEAGEIQSNAVEVEEATIIEEETIEEKVYESEPLFDTPVTVGEKKEVSVNAKRKRK
jgi:6-phosphofructokinase